MLSFTSSGLPTSASSAFSWSSTSELVFAHSQATQPSLFAFCTIATFVPAPSTVEEPSFESWNCDLPLFDATFEKPAAVVVAASPPPSPAPSAASSWLSNSPYSLRSVASDVSLASTAPSSVLDFSSPSPSKRRTSRQRPSDQFEYLQYLSSSSSDEDDDSRPSTLPPTSQKILLFTRQPASPSRKMMPARVLPQYEAKWRL